MHVVINGAIREVLFDYVHKPLTNFIETLSEPTLKKCLSLIQGAGTVGIRPWLNPLFSAL